MSVQLKMILASRNRMSEGSNTSDGPAPEIACLSTCRISLVARSRCRYTGKPERPTEARLSRARA